ncbi:hypothetical protein [Azospirillum sp. B2RO_4]|uniref:hypothetical protein n=1 Tax=Azospirillum sp. B2RO_4 TaxID=3027796 RepID=UPI003DA87FBB
MLTISDGQFDRLREVSDAAFSKRLANFLIEADPDAGDIPFEELLTTAERQMARARAYGIVTEHGFAVYFLTAWILGEDFDTAFPAAQTVLEDSGTALSAKTDWLEQWTLQILETLENQ